MYETIAEYRETPTLTKVSLSKPLPCSRFSGHAFFEVHLHAYPLYDFPPFVVCSRTWFDTAKALKMGLTLDGLKYSLGYMGAHYGGLLKLTNLSEARENFQTVFAKRNFQNLIHFYKHIAVDLKPHYSKASFYNSTEPSYLVEGEYPVMRKDFMPLGSICYNFTIRPLDGQLGSLMRAENVLIKFQDRTQDLIPVSKDWFLHFCLRSLSAYAWPLVVPHSVTNYLRIQAETFASHPSAKHPCQEGAMKNNANTAAACMADCQNEFYKEALGCKLFWMGSQNESTRETPDEYCHYFELHQTNQTEAAQNFYRDRRARIAEQAKDTCYGRCSRHCERTVYEATLQGTDLNFDEFYGIHEMEALKRANMTLTTFSLLNDAMRQGGVITFHEVTSYSFVELASNVGGTLGLFLGGALMTFAQVILFFVQYFQEKQGGKGGQ